MKKVSNPLTIIAIFAGLAEVACSTALVALGSDIQAIFVWFVMAFPFTLVLLFFCTLWFKPTTLYAPSDYSNEDNFLSALGVTSKLSAVIENLRSEVAKIEQQIASGSNDTKAKDSINKLKHELDSSKADVASLQKTLKQGSVLYSMRLNSKLADVLREQASKEGKPLSQFLSESLQSYLDR